MKLESLTPLERIAYVAARRLRGDSLDPFCVLARTHVQLISKPTEPAIREKLIQLLGPVLIMEAFAKAIGDKLRGAGQVYMLGDSAVMRLAEGVGLAPEQSWDAHLETLSCMSLIFRFPVALKFGYSDAALTQLRSNSWSNVAAQQMGLHSRPEFHDTVARIESAVEDHLELYAQLVRTCQSPARPLNVEMIHSLNERVPIPIVT